MGGHRTHPPAMPQIGRRPQVCEGSGDALDASPVITCSKTVDARIRSSWHVRPLLSRKCYLRRVRVAYASKADSGKPPQDVFMSSHPGTGTVIFFNDARHFTTAYQGPVILRKPVAGTCRTSMSVVEHDAPAPEKLDRLISLVSRALLIPLTIHQEACTSSSGEGASSGR
jgi:hypothetical protein